MTAQPIHEEDPRDPEQILARLPERERDQFLREYRAAAKAAAHEVWRYKELQTLLFRWHLIAIATRQPDYYQRLEEAKAGIGDYVDWADAIHEYRQRRQ